MKKLLSNLGLLKDDFDALFFQNEFVALSNRTGSNLWLLALISLLTFSALGYAIGSYRYLDYRMNNPLTNWINVPIIDENEEDLRQLEDHLLTGENKESYQIAAVKKFSTDYSYFKNYKDKSYFAWQRTLSFAEDMDLMKIVLLKSNVIYKADLEEEELQRRYDKGDGLILTDQFIETLVNDSPDQQRKIKIQINEGRNTYDVYREVLAIVKELPSPPGLDLDFICSPRFYNSYQELDKDISTGNADGLFVTDHPNSQEIIQFLTSVDEEYEISVQDFEIRADVQHQQYRVHHSNLKKIDKKDLLDQLSKEYPAYTFEPYILWEVSQYEPRILENPEYISFIFKEWDEIRQFNDTLKMNYPQVKIDMTKVEEKENFGIVSNLTRSLAFALFLFGVFSILALINSALRSHFKEITPNIGTFKAFGLSDKRIARIYQKIVGSFLFLILSPTIFLGILFHIFGILIWGRESIFDFLNVYILLAILALVFITILLIQNTIRKLLEHPPGDLIYQRI